MGISDIITSLRNHSLSRREWMKHMSMIGMGSVVGFAEPRESRGSERDMHGWPQGNYNKYFGDLHMHNNIGYAQGSLRRSFEIAREHLDFYALTPHAHWHDIGEYENNIENKWINGFAVTRARWPEVVEANREFDEPGEFITIPGYEWHSTNLGDYHVLFPDLDVSEEDLFLPDELPQLQSFAKRRGCIMVPHHPANRQGHRGANFAHRDPEVSPVLEMYSEWGNAEHDRAPYPYIRHTEGGRWTKNTLQYLLAEGHRVGVLASSDDHLGFPGAYNQGLAVILAEQLSREAIFDALWNRRTYAVTGDRIELDFMLNGRVMGQELPYARDRELQVVVSGWGQVDRVEVLKNNRVIHRDFPVDRIPSSESWNEPVLLRFEYGWGPWPALGLGRTADWDVTISVDGGRIVDLQPCYQSGPLDEERRDRIISRRERSVRFKSFTALREQFEDRSQKAMVLKVEGGPETQVTISTSSPTENELTLSFKELAESNEMLFTGPFPDESAMVHRLVFNERYETSFSVTDQDEGEEDNWYYVRVVQANRQLAWSSPIWVNQS